MPIDINNSYRQWHIVFPEFIHQANVFFIGICVYPLVINLLSRQLTYSIETTNYQVTTEGSKAEDRR